MKRVLIHLRGYKCEICHIENWNNKSLMLQMDHIDGNADNNDLSNLQLLCPNCHSQTETWGGHNTSNSKRAKYQKRYRILKLYGEGDGVRSRKSPESQSGALTN